MMDDIQQTTNERPGPLERLRRRLYKRGLTLKNIERTKLMPKNVDERRDWSVDSPVPSQSILSTSLLLKALWVAIAFFVVSLAILGYRFWYGSNIVSRERIDIVVKGPVSVRAGDELDLQILVVNNNNSKLTSADVVVEFPPGARSAKNPREEVTQVRQMLGEVEPGGTVSMTAKALLFGEEGSEKKLKIGLEYRLPNASAIFEKAKVYTLNIGSAPINVNLDIPAEVIVGEKVTLNIKATANSGSLIKGVLLSVAYPPGFQFSQSSIKPSFGNNVWNLGDLTAGTERNLQIDGYLVGQGEDVRAFRVTAGPQDSYDKNKIGLTYVDVFKTVSINRPYLDTELVLTRGNDELEEDVIDSGQRYRGRITWFNNLSTRITDGQIELEVTGAALDKRQITVEGGVYRSVDNRFIWNQNDVPELASVEPGASGMVDFGFAALTLEPGSAKPEIVFKLTARAKRVSETSASELIEVNSEKVVRVNSSPTLTTMATHAIGPITNHGPLPPQVDQETTYTITWSISNPTNDLKGVKVRAVIPAYMKWLGAVVPAEENIAFNPDLNEVVWDADIVRAGTGFGSEEKREISFQLGLIPSTSQVNQQVQLIGETKFTATDTFTGKTLTSTLNSLDSNLENEPGFSGEWAKVVAP